MSKIFIIAPFAWISRSGLRNRFKYLADRLVQNGYNVLVFTSNFSHQKKEHISHDDIDDYNFDIKLIEELGYSKNVSIKRAVSHLSFSYKLKQEIKKYDDKVDLIYAAYPTMSSSYIASKIAKKNNIPFVLDILDTWPESISSAIDTDKIHIKALMYPFTLFANHIYKQANLVFGVSNSYVQRANLEGSKSNDFLPVYIGADLDFFDSVKTEDYDIKKDDKEIWVTYIGTLSHSYDIDTAIKTFSELKKYEKLKLNIIGTGPDEARLKKLAKRLDLFNQNVKFYGFVDYKKMVALLKKSNIALNALTAGSRGTVTNKFGDYVSAKLPILNSCQENEIIELVENKKLGINYSPGDSKSLKKALLNLLNNQEYMLSCSKNARSFAEEHFDRKGSYKIIIDKINELI